MNATAEEELPPSEEQDDKDEQAFEPNIRPAYTGLMCPFDLARPCGANCMAYVTFPRRSAVSELNEQSAHCSLIVGVERLGRNLTILTEMEARAEKKRQLAEADKRQRGQFAPATRSPFGGKKDE